MVRGMTNNAVEFLVTLGIDEEPSKKKIDKFLTTVTGKQLKLTFGVNVGDSNTNIKTFIDKHKEKTLKLDFEVNRTKSSANIKTFTDTLQGLKANVTFQVDIKKSQTNINNALKEIKVQHITTDIDVNRKQSRANINKFLTDLKLSKKLIDLDVNKTVSKQNISTYLTNLKLAKIGVAIDLAKGGLSDVKTKAQGTEIKGIKGVLELDVAKTKERIKTQIENMKLPKFKIDVIANVKTNQVPSTQEKSTSKTSTPIKPDKPKKDSGLLLDGYVGTKGEVVEKLKKDLKEMGKEVHLFQGSVEKSQQDFINRLIKQGAKLDVVRDAQTQEVTKITATHRNSANELISTVYKPLIATYDSANKKIKDGSKSVRGFVAETDKINYKTTFDFSEGMSKLINKFDTAIHKGHLTKVQTLEIEKALKLIGNNDDISKVTKQLDEYTTSTKRAIELDKARLNLITQREQLLANLTRTERMYRLSAEHKNEAESVKATIGQYDNEKIGKLNLSQIREANEQFAITRGQIKTLNAEATEATKNSMGVASALKVAMEKFPIWMVASTAFFGAIRTIKEFGTIIVDIDTKMTDLKKVMADGTDFGKVFSDATEQAKEFGQTISSTLDAYSMFAKQGFKGEELNDLASAGLVAGNVGDIETGKASEYLTASILQWNKQTNEAMSIVDSWNEISNNYATTVENLAQGQAKAGATAKALGMDFNQLNAVVGVLNAKTKQSGNEIGNFIKSTFPNLLSQKGGDVLAKLGVSLEDGQGNLRDIMDIYKDVAREYKKLSQAEQNQVTLGLGGKYHISRLQTLLDDLGQVDSMYDKMLKSSENSANSAMNENEKYMQSLQARINLARVEVEKLAVAIGDAVMTDSMVAGLQLFSTVLSGITFLVGKIGVLPITILAVATALTMFSNRFGGLVGKVGSGERLIDKLAKTLSFLGNITKKTSVDIQGNTGHIKNNTSETNKNADSKNKASKASKLLSASFGAVGIASVLAGFAIEGLIGLYGKLKKQKEELKAKNEQEIKSFAENEKSIDSLVAKYTELSAKSEKTKLGSTEYKELLDTQNELGKLLPDLKKGEDEYGNSILVSSQQAQTKVEILKQELEIQKKITAERAKADRKDEEKTARGTISDANDKKDDGLKEAYRKLSKMEELNKEFKDKFTKGFKGDSLNNIEDVTKAIEKINDALSKKSENNLSKGTISDLTITKNALQDIYVELLQSQQDVLSGLNIFREGYKTDLADIIKSSGDFSEEGQKYFEDMANSVINLAESEDDLKDFKDSIGGALSFKNGDIEKEFDKLAKSISDMKDSGVTDAKQLESEFGAELGKIKKHILNNLVESGIGKDTQAYKNWETVLTNVIETSLEEEKAVKDIMKAQGMGRKEAEEYFRTHSEGADDIATASEEMQKYVSSIKNFDSIGERMLGVNDKLITETNELVDTYKYLSSVTNRTADEQSYLEEAMKNLKALYPHLVKNGELRIENVENETKINKILLESHNNMADGKYNSEEKATYYSSLGTKARIQNIQTELDAMEKAKTAFKVSTEVMSLFSGVSALAMKAQTIAWETLGSSKEDALNAQLDEEIAKLNTGINSLSASNYNYSESSEKASKSSKDNKKEMSDLEKVTAKYALTLDKLNTSLKEVESRKKKYPVYSKQYRQALAEENKLIDQQIKLSEQKIKDLQVVANTATTTVDDGGTYTVGGTVKPKGFQGQITSNWATRADNHKGIDIDGKKGDLLQSNVSGKVVSTGKDGVSGNYIYVMDGNGLKHFYAHLDSIAVAIGDVVDVGTKLGTIGNTGNVYSGSGGDGSHLHYGVKQGDKWVDPTSYAQSARGGVQTYSQTKVVSGGSAQATVWNYFKSKGLSDSAVAGIMGNLQQESNYNSNAGKNTQGSAYGIAQWRGSRLSELNSYAKGKGTSASDLNTQLEFMWKELQGKEMQALHSLERTLSATEHASNFNTLYERSGEKAGSKGHNNRVNNAQNVYNTYAGKGSTGGSGGSGGSSVVPDTSQRNDASSQVESEKQNLISLKEKRQEQYFEELKSYLAQFQRNRDIEDLGIAKQEELQKNMLEYNKAYEDSVNKQYTAEQRKLKSYQAEYAYIQKMYDAGGLTITQQDELIDKRYELQQQMLESQNQIKEYYNQVISGKLAGFDHKRDGFAKTLEWEEVKIQALDKTSTRYTKTLEIMANTRKGQLTSMKQELDYVNQMLGKGNLTVSMYEELTQRAESLKKELVEVNQALHQMNYEMVQAVAFSHDIKIDDLNFELSYNQSLRDLYEEGSGDYLKTYESDMEILQKLLIETREKEIEMKQKMQGMDLGSKELEDLENQLQQIALDYNSIQKSVIDTQKAIDDFNKSVEDKVKEERKNLAEKIIDALKDAYNEAKEIQLDAIDELIEAEEKRHEKAMKALDDELEAYTKIIDAKRRKIQDEDRDRTHGNKLDDLNSQKQDLQSKLNLLSNVNTYEGKKEKEELQKQIAEIEKQIAEEKYQYEKDLREQQLDDMLDQKTENIEDLKEKEDEYSKDVLDSLNKQKKYWEKHYEDLLNDEKKFNELREEMAQGHYGKVEELYNKYIGELKASLPDLEDRFDGTWEAVGTSIRENVIHEMENLLEEIKKVEIEVERVKNLSNNVTGKYGDMSDANQTAENHNNGKGQLNEADMKVILAKFMNEKIAGSLDPKTDAVRIKNIKDKADKLAKEGRSEGSTYNANQSLGSIFDSMTQEQISQIGGYFQNNSDASGFMTKEYLDYIKEFGKTASAGKVLSHGDKQVMLAKYMRETLVPQANSQAKKDALKGTSDKIAQSGRNNLSLVSAGTSYDQAFTKLSGKQQAELGQYMLDNSSVVSYPELRSILTGYADNIRRNSSNDFVGADKGGMTTGFGSTGGTDGKGGRLALLHENELVSNPLDTERMLRISSIMDNVMRTINGAIALPTQPKVSTISTPTSTDNSTVVHISIDKFNGTKNDIDKLGDQIKNRLLREKGKR
ncbi:phage tail tape measure protein [Lysinibacillus xylanilyticus]|uniref:phage tail tape measure protein n=1 Tax=Lysinibacillus xylanilyticus TaxID=582475 RepID=UPI0037F29DB7